jgi:hypothetical protein
MPQESRRCRTLAESGPGRSGGRSLWCRRPRLRRGARRTNLASAPIPDHLGGCRSGQVAAPGAGGPTCRRALRNGFPEEWAACSLPCPSSWFLASLHAPHRGRIDLEVVGHVRCGRGVPTTHAEPGSPLVDEPGFGAQDLRCGAFPFAVVRGAPFFAEHDSNSSSASGKALADRIQVGASDGRREAVLDRPDPSARAPNIRPTCWRLLSPKCCAATLAGGKHPATRTTALSPAFRATVGTSMARTTGGTLLSRPAVRILVSSVSLPLGRWPPRPTRGDRGPRPRVFPAGWAGPLGSLVDGVAAVGRLGPAAHPPGEGPASGALDTPPGVAAALPVAG